MPESLENPLVAKKLQQDYCDGVKNVSALLHDFARKMDPVAGSLARSADVLHRRVEDIVVPFSVAVFGRMKTGKSSLINALVGSRLAITGREPTTATINRLVYAAAERGREQLQSFKVHWKDGFPETFPLSRLEEDWSGDGESVEQLVKRTKFLELYFNAEWLRDIEVIDTPGTGSAVPIHEEVARQFIDGKSADALVYVFAPQGRETDKRDLESFRKGCLPESSPSNSVAVMHKWDETYWHNGGDWEDILGKAHELHKQMHELVAEVVPVSAPLALVSQIATHGFWKLALEVLAAFPDEKSLKSALMADFKWNAVQERRALYATALKAYDMPWPSFRVMLRELFRKQCPDEEAAKACLMELSGIGRLRTMLDNRFFKRRAILRMRHTRSQVRDDMHEIQNTMADAKEALRKDIGLLEQVLERMPDDTLRPLLEIRVRKRESELSEIEQTDVRIDRLRFSIEEGIQNADDALELIPWLEENTALFPEPWQVPELLAYLQDGTPIPKEHWQKQSATAAGIALDMDIKTKRMGEKLRDILFNIPTAGQS